LVVGWTLAAAGAGCGSSVAGDCFGRECDTGSDSDTDADTDADADSDSDGDSDTATDSDSSTQADEHVDCEAEPETCEDIGATEEAQGFGCCFEGAVYFCQAGFLDSIDCEAQGYACGYAPGWDMMDCI
jgi:hypothetical protein